MDKKKVIYLKLIVSWLLIIFYLSIMGHEMSILVISKSSVNPPHKEGLNVEWTNNLNSVDYNSYDLILITPGMLESMPETENIRQTEVVGVSTLRSGVFWSRLYSSSKTGKYPYHLPEISLFLGILLLSTVKFGRSDIGKSVFTYSLLAYLLILLYLTITEMKSPRLETLSNTIIIVVLASGIKVALELGKRG